MQPEKATVYEKPAGKEEAELKGALKTPKEHSAAYVVEAKIKIYCEEDAIAAEAEGATGILSMESRRAHADLFRELVVPKISQEVNEGRNFSKMRQIYNSMILATWFKRTHGDSKNFPSFIESRDSSLIFTTNGDHSFITGESRMYPDSSIQIATSNEGVDLNELYYQEYVKLFREGLRQTVQTVDVSTGQITRKTYLSGKVDATRLPIRSTFSPYGLPPASLYWPTLRARLDSGRL